MALSKSREIICLMFFSSPHIINLLSCAFRPLVLTLHHLKYFGVRINDRKRCFDLVACIRDETFLFFVTF
jgi:hypothetical protein